MTFMAFEDNKEGSSEEDSSSEEESSDESSSSDDEIKESPKVEFLYKTIAHLKNAFAKSQSRVKTLKGKLRTIRNDACMSRCIPFENDFIFYPTLPDELPPPFEHINIASMHQDLFGRPRLDGPNAQITSFSSLALSAENATLFKWSLTVSFPLSHSVQQMIHMPFGHLITDWLEFMKIDVLARGIECDIALLAVESEEFWKGVEPLRFGQLPCLQVQIYSCKSILMLSKKRTCFAGNSGGPAFNDRGECIGVAFQEPSLHAAVMLEQASYCYLLSIPPMLRKYGFHLVLSGNRYYISDQRQHAIQAYRNALFVYRENGWSYISDHVHYNVGRFSMLCLYICAFIFDAFDLISFHLLTWYSFIGVLDLAI
ncbi:hypothetical protein ZIOFF_038839 [Zingiber officinale]|uniref:Uncharacterized protein n=1 Tax=Zingiber officinale TaxID=94328 RepID=A0A8J5G195_ZINOF|nr:hypothetical protein ZIOFF_038839 [Zingiber officinale]